VENLNQEFKDLCIDISILRGNDRLPPVTSPNLEVLDMYPWAFSDFYGLPSNPVCIYRTGDEWPIPTGFESQPVLREARPICKHPIQKVWFTLGTQIYQFLDSLEVKWSTIDPVRFAEEGKDAGPLHLWVGVTPRSLSFDNAKAAATGCKKILADANLPDVEIAFRESHFIQSTGPQLLDCVPIWPFMDPTADVSSPFTPALGIPIAPQRTPHSEGTGALYLHESSQSDRVLLLTARHIVFPPLKHKNELYVRNSSSEPGHVENVLILGSKAYSDAIADMLAQIGVETILIDTYKRQLEALGKATEGDNDKVTTARQVWQDNLTKAERTITNIYNLHGSITRNWTTVGQRFLGNIIHAPPISFGTGPKEFTEDWAIINLFHDKINWDKFRGNVIHLGTF
jgi:hypothetical protein